MFVSAAPTRKLMDTTCPKGSRALLNLCGSLHDQSASLLQIKINAYLCERTNAEKAFLILVSEEEAELYCQVIGAVVLDEEIKFTKANNSFSTALTDRRSITYSDIQPGHRKDIEDSLGFTVTSLLAVPITNATQEEKIILIACVANKISDNKENENGFTPADILVIEECFRYTSTLLMNTLALEEEKRLKLQCQSLLTVAKNLFTHLDDVTVLLREIMAEARNLTKAERCSLFLLDREQNELVAKVFDGNLAENGQENGLEVRIPSNEGIAGHVAMTGKLLNIRDAYSHPQFYRRMDETTGFKTRNILCFPIKDEKDVIGIAELCNKVNGLYFSTFDEEIATAFSIYCGISIMHSLMYKKVRDAQHRSKLSNELMMYHMKVPCDEVVKLASTEIPKPTCFDANFCGFHFAPRSIADDSTTLAVLSMFDDLGMISRWRIPRETLARFVLMVRKGYRDPPYHNWAHAFSVAHFCFLVLNNLQLLKDVLTDLEALSLFVACLCHDLDHRGTTNSFQVASQSVLAALYSSEGSVMERHHLAQAMCILNTEGCNIFDSLTRKEYTACLDHVRDLILATDLAHHIRLTNDIKELVSAGYDKNNARHHQLLLCLLMTACDLSDQTKDWRSSKKIAELVYREFFSQGDLEKAMGSRPHVMMDRDKACIPELQINFLGSIAMPVFQMLTMMFPAAGPLLTAVMKNKIYWERMRDAYKRRNTSSSMDIFDDETMNAEVLASLAEQDDECFT